MIFVEHKNVKERVNALNFCKGVGEYAFEKSCQDGAFRYLKHSQCLLNTEFCKGGILEYCKNGRGVT